VRNYVNERAKSKSGINPEKFKVGEKIDWDSLPKEFYEARKSIGESLFLEFRSRREQAFIDHFAQTLFSSKQYLSEDQFTTIGHALLKQTDDVKTLTLMSLSANS
jgi:CRISPR-associated protein Cmx8